MGDFNRKETARVLSSMRRASYKQLQAPNARASAAVVYPTGSCINSGSRRRAALPAVALTALVLSLTALVAYTLLVLSSTRSEHEA
jgi:hypothetical protein